MTKGVRTMSQSDLAVCCACGRGALPASEDPTGESELRPYGPGGAPICYSCAMASERLAETNRQFHTRLDAAESASLADGGTVAHVVLTPDGPKPLKTGRS